MPTTAPTIRLSSIALVITTPSVRCDTGVGEPVRAMPAPHDAVEGADRQFLDQQAGARCPVICPVRATDDDGGGWFAEFAAMPTTIASARQRDELLDRVFESADYAWRRMNAVHRSMPARVQRFAPTSTPTRRFLFLAQAGLVPASRFSDSVRMKSSTTFIRHSNRSIFFSSSITGGTRR